MRALLTTESEYRLMPWKNGLGVTREMAVFPSGANLERGDFLWRLSSADVGTSGPFSPSRTSTSTQASSGRA